MSEFDPTGYLAALDDARHERASLYPHAAREPDRSVDEGPPAVDGSGRRLSPVACELGRRRVDQLRSVIAEQIERVRSREAGW